MSRKVRYPLKGVTQASVYNDAHPHPDQGDRERHGGAGHWRGTSTGSVERTWRLGAHRSPMRLGRSVHWRVSWDRSPDGFRSWNPAVP